VGARSSAANCRGEGVKHGDCGQYLVAPGALPGNYALQGRDPVGDLGGVPRDRSCSSSVTSRPSASLRAGGRACWTNNNASSPRASSADAASLAGEVRPPTASCVVHERQHS
jgi:hypothetical protein